MGAIRVHEFISLDSVIDTPSWTFPFGFDPRMGEAIGRITTSSDGILLGRTTYQMFEPAWSRRTKPSTPEHQAPLLGADLSPGRPARHRADRPCRRSTTCARWPPRCWRTGWCWGSRRKPMAAPRAT